VPIAPGDTLCNRYVIVTLIGRGGMGEVFSARRIADAEHVAIKVVRRSAVDESHMARLAREAEAARRIRSAFVPEVFDVDRTEDGELFVVMRLVAGLTLTERLRARRSLAWTEVRDLVDDVLSGLIDAHAAGVVHRDLKPGNILLEWVEAQTIPSAAVALTQPTIAREYARILDFGVCKLDASDGEKLTHTGETVGTVSYMAPEQIRGASTVDGRADLYALAIVAYEAITSRLPFSSDGQMALLAEKLEGRARHVLKDAREPIPAGLDALLAKALSREPGRRFRGAAEMRLAWRDLGPAIPMSAQPAGSRQDSIGPENATGAPAIVPAPALGSRVGLGIAAAASVMAVLALATLVIGRATATPAPPALSPPPSAAIGPETPDATAAPDAPTPPAAIVRERDDAAAPLAPAPKSQTAVADAGARRPSRGPPTQTPHITTKPRY
jgi:serine/threonine-protein kinase